MRAFFRNWFIESNRGERIWMMAVMDFKLRYYENKLGLLWALIKPITQILVYTIAFNVIFTSRTENFAIYLFSALVLWNFILECSTGSVHLLSSKQYLYEYTNMSKLEIYLAVMLSNLIGLLLNIAIYFIVASFVGIFPSFSSLLALLIIVNAVILGLGLSMILSNLFLLFSDISQIWGVFVQFLFFLSPIIYDTSLFLEKLPFMVYLNPICGIIINFRQAVFYHSGLDWPLFLWTLLYSLGVLGLGAIMLKKIAPKASELLA